MGFWATAVLLALVGFSAFLSSSEIGLFSLSRFQLRALKEKHPSVHRRAKRLLSRPGDLLITILLLNEITNISIAALVASGLSKKHSVLSHALPWIPEWALDTLLGLFITTPILLIFCEISPKVVAARLNSLVTRTFSRALAVFFDVLKPVRWALGGLLGVLLGGRRSTTERERDQQALLKESEFLMMMEEGHQHGAIEESELELIKNVFELDDLTVSRITTSWGRVQSISQTATLKNALQIYKSRPFSRIPVFGPNRKRVVGVLYSKDLLRARLQPELLGRTVESVMKKPFFVSPDLKLNTLFRKFKQNRVHLAIVQNHKQEALGIVTMSDLLEVLIDDLLPEEPLRPQA